MNEPLHKAAITKRAAPRNDKMTRAALYGIHDTPPLRD